MIETIPNPIADKTIREDIRAKVDEIIKSPLKIGGLDIAMRNAITRAAEWGLKEGFRLGWRVHEARTKGGTPCK